MSQENVELMNDAYAAINRGDLEAFLSLIDLEVEFNSLIAELEGQTWRGHDRVGDWWERVKSSLGGLRYETEEVRGIGDCTVAKLLVTGRAGGVAMPQSMWCATRIRNRRAIWWGVYRTEAEAVQATGLSE
jgi:ketosteroid isomerase-like protein